MFAAQIPADDSGIFARRSTAAHDQRSSNGPRISFLPTPTADNSRSNRFGVLSPQGIGAKELADAGVAAGGCAPAFCSRSAVDCRHNLLRADKSYVEGSIALELPVDEEARKAMRLWTLALPTVSALVTSLVRDFRDRDDVLQETAVAVVESFERYDPARSFVGWALGIARNQVGLYLRRRGRDRHTFDTEAVEHLAVALENVSPEELHRLDHLRDCMQRLEGRARQLCDLRYRDDLKPAAIAATVGMSANTVAKALQRIRDQLRTCIETRAATAL